MVRYPAGSGRVVAVLGPTNTGKTHFAVERMLAHRSGMMGFPLRLLAREIYDRIVGIKGRAACALITGEEKVGTEDAAYLVCTVEAMPVQRPYNPNARRMAEIMQADLAKIGVEAEIVSYEWGEYLEKAKDVKRDGALLLGWTGDNGDPDNFFFLRGCAATRPGGQNLTKWCNKEFDDRLVKARTLSDTAERTKLYEEMQVIMKAEAPDMTIAHSVVYEPVRAEVVDWKISPFGRHEFYGVALK